MKVYRTRLKLRMLGREVLLYETPPVLRTVRFTNPYTGELGTRAVPFPRAIMAISRLGIGTARQSSSHGTAWRALESDYVFPTTAEKFLEEQKLVPINHPYSSHCNSSELNGLDLTLVPDDELIHLSYSGIGAASGHVPWEINLSPDWKKTLIKELRSGRSESPRGLLAEAGFVLGHTELSIEFYDPS